MEEADALTLATPGPRARLSQQQLQLLAAALLQGPQAHGYPTQLWTLERITDLIDKQTGVTYHPGHVWYLLQQMGWSCQKPQTKAKERNEAAIAHWIEVDWPRIKKGRSSEEPLTGNEGLYLAGRYQLQWLPNGKRLSFLYQKTLWTVPVSLQDRTIGNTSRNARP